MPCYPSSSLTMCPRWDESGQTPSNIRLHRLDGDRLPVTIGDLQDDDHPHPLFLPSTSADNPSREHLQLRYEQHQHQLLLEGCYVPKIAPLNLAQLGLSQVKLD